MIHLTKTNLVYLLLYTTSNIFILLNYDGLYWDDWVSYNQDSQTMAILYDMIKFGIKGDFYLILENMFNHIYAFRLFTFFAYLFIGYFIYKIILSTKIFNTSTSKFIGFLSVIIPINAIKTYTIMTVFTFPMLLFYFAFFLLSKNYPLPNKSLKIIILTIFFFSFSTNSILVFYASVLLYLYYMDNNKSLKINYTIVKTYMLKRWDFILLPIFYFLYMSIYLVPHGLYDGYNKVSFSIEKIIHSINISSQYMTKDLFISLVENNYIVTSALIVSGIIAFFLKHDIKIEWRQTILLFILSIVLFIFATLPYAAVGKTPVLIGNNGRFALLLGPAIAMFFIAVITLLSHLFFKYKQKIFLFLVSFIVITMVSKNFSQQYEFMLDNFYQASIIENFKTNDDIKDNTTFVVYPYKTRSYYVWNGLAKKAFNDTKRLMLLPSKVKLSHGEIGDNLFQELKEYRQYKQYNFYMWNLNRKYLKVLIQENTPVTPLTETKLIFYYLFDKKIFKNLVKMLVKIEVKS